MKTPSRRRTRPISRIDTDGMAEILGQRDHRGTHATTDRQRPLASKRAVGGLGALAGHVVKALAPLRHPEAVVGEVSAQSIVRGRKVGRAKPHEIVEAARLERFDEGWHLCRLRAAIGSEVRDAQARRIGPSGGAALPFGPSGFDRLARGQADDRAIGLSVDRHA